MKEKLSLATSLTSALLIIILVSVKIPFLIFTAFILLLANGVRMFLNFTSESYKMNEEEPKENINKLVFFRFLIQLIPVVYMALCFYFFLERKKIWLELFLN